MAATGEAVDLSAIVEWKTSGWGLLRWPHCCLLWMWGRSTVVLLLLLWLLLLLLVM
jgi:hypothetical protein